ncbi:DUF2599 domain-containing protein [Paenarthrobacter sp. Z7-10]|nr:DUF2599 domain-containing protein [Paenarthrobacter sp. Z7-10]
MAGVAGVPVGAKAAFVNFQVDNTNSIAGYINPYATSATSRPGVSLSFPGTPYTSTGAMVPLDSSGAFKLYLSTNNTINLLMDVEGYFTQGSSNGTFTPAISKLYDSRAAAHIAPGQTVTIPVGGVGGIPDTGHGLTAVVANLSVIDNSASGGYARAWASGADEPSNVGALTFATGTHTNLITVPVGISDGAVQIHNVSPDTVDYIVDLEGWYTAPTPTVTCPQPYQAGSWTTTVPTVAVTCWVHLPTTEDPEGTLDININLGAVDEQQLPANGTLDYPITVPPTAGWYDIGVTANYSSGVSTETHYSFGLEAGSPSAAISAIQRANPAAFENVANASTTSTGAIAVQTTVPDALGGSASVSTNPSTGVTLSQEEQTTTDPFDGSTSTIPASTMSMSLPFSPTASSAHVESNGVVSYDNHNGSTTVSILKQDASVQLNTVIQGANAPASYVYPVNMPAGAKLSANDDGSVTIVDSVGNFLGGISAPWAVDAGGGSVPTHYDISGSSLIQVVDLSHVTAYPVVADPWFGIALIQKTVWSYAYKNDPRLMVYPTVWGRAWSGPALWKVQWSEVITKTTSYRSRANTPDMYYQFVCHQELGAEYWKGSYNLDSNIRRGSLFQYLIHKCN